MKSFAIVIFMGLIAIGCDDSKKSEPSALPSSVVAPSPTSAAAVPASTGTAVAGAIPAEEDFETKAEASITPANANEELAKLDKEIGQ